MDQLLVSIYDILIEQKQVNLNCRNPGHIWSIEYVQDFVLVKYHYDEEFSKLMRNYMYQLYLDVKWNESLQGWQFNKKFDSKLFAEIKNTFPEWKCIDKRM